MDIFAPLQWLADIISYDLFRLAQGSQLGSGVNFFLYDTLKIGLLLLAINYLMAIVRYYLPMEKLRDFLTSRNWYGFDYLLAAIFGVITPFCSCSSIPLFIGFLRAGIPLGVTTAFLITSPLVNEASLVILPVLFGIRITILYNLLGMAVGIVGGMIIQRLHLEKCVEPSLLTTKVALVKRANRKKPVLRELLVLWWREAWEIAHSIFPYVLLGVGLGAVIHGLIPVNFFEKYLSAKSWWAVPLATLMGVPLYANSVSVIPIVEALVAKGVSLGTALAFMTATVTLSIPEALILRKAMKPPLLLTFFGITTVGIMVIGFFFNVVH